MFLMGNAILQEAFALPLTRIGEAIPDSKSVTTQGSINFPFDHQGKWVLIQSPLPMYL